MGKSDEPLFYVLIATSLLCLLLNTVRDYQVDQARYGFMLWNLFLAWLPLVVSMIALQIMRLGEGLHKWLALLICAVSWLLLYPNAPYLTTDFIHLIFNTSYGPIDADRLLLWYDLVMFFLFAWSGLLLGFLSMRHFHAIVNYYVNPTFGWVMIFFSSFLSGFGVYLGRVVRLNSWDIVFNPFHLIQSVLEGINTHAAIFSLLFGILILTVYVTLYMLGGNRNGIPKDQVRPTF